MIQFENFSYEILMILESPGSCCQAMMVWILQEAAVKPISHFSKEILMVLNFRKAAVMQFTQLSNEMFLF